MRILLVEDEKYIAEPIAQILKRNNYSVDLAFDGEYGLDCVLSNIYDVIILDIMLPKMDGLALLKEARQNAVETPVLLLTAKSQLEDKISGLDHGADDYLTKPFEAEELLARLRALTRRKPELRHDGVMSFGDVRFSPHLLTLACKGNEAKLTLKESQILELLCQQKNRVVSKDQIIEKVWGYDAEAEDGNVETHISLLRKKIRKIKSGLSLVTIRGAGYVLEDKAGDR
ncbi:MAG: response regulator transcription factor [Christensenellaceae bacterium]|jgi:DNA-binding response OmpR family regulator|nr:response regulator transcription factor [Christensenellaceae bacterium]